VLVWSLSACASNPSYQNVSVQALHDATEHNRIVLDVRTPQEFAEGHVLGAKLIPVQELEARLDEVPDNAPVYVICRSGNRSRTASEILIKNGKRDVRNVEGGVIAWAQTGFHLEKP
jgi:rhodanese-related sulfurtransferase